MTWLKHFANKYIYNESLELEARIINMIVILGELVAIIALVMRLLAGASLGVIAFMLMILVVLPVGFLLVNKFSIHKYAIPIVLIFLGCIVFPALFFMHGGNDSGITAFFIIPAVAIFILIHGWRRIVMFLLQALSVIFCYGMALLPEPIFTVTPINSVQAFFDNVMSWAIVGFFLGMVALFQRLIYDKEKTRADRATMSITRMSELRESLNSMAMILLSAKQGDRDHAFRNSLGTLAETFNVDGIRIWQALEKDNGMRRIKLFESYPLELGFLESMQKDTFYIRDDEEIAQMLLTTKDYLHILKEDFDLLGETKDVLGIAHCQSVVAIPIHIRDDLWGFVTFSYTNGMYPVDRDEISIMKSAVIMIADSIVLQQTLDDMAEAREQALFAMRSKSDFLANMSHEIRTPISAIVGMTNLALADGDDSSNSYRLNRIKEASYHLMGVINDILDMSKIEAGKFKLRPKPFYTKALIDRMLSIVRFKAEGKYQQLDSFIDERLPPLLVGDEQRLAQVLMNLLSNAIKFTPEDGHITLGCTVVKNTAKYSTIAFSVIDDGIGIKAEEHAGLFAAFEQIDSGAARRYSGTGLGLAISKNIVEAMGGTIEVISELGKGATFKFTLDMEIYSDVNAPKAYLSDIDEEVLSLQSLIQNHDFNLSRYRALVAEDVDVNFEVLAAFLEPTAIRMDWAKDGRSALDMYLKNNGEYDLIFMDIQMPEMNGLEVTRAIRASDMASAKSVPIIAMTANVFTEDILQCYQSGMNSHLGKPLDFIQLISTIKHHLDIQ